MQIQQKETPKAKQFFRTSPSQDVIQGGQQYFQTIFYKENHNFQAAL